MFFKMKKTIAIFLSLCLLLIGNAYSQKNIEKGLNQITPELLKQYIDYLASDSMKGRNTPSRELDLAADYIAKEFESMGIQKVNGSYYQNIPFCSKNLDVKNSTLKITLGESSKDFALKTDFTPFEATANMSISSEVVFAGYGITAKEYNYDDYKDIDVKGKIVLILKHEPAEKDMKSPFMGDQETKYSFPSYKLENAMNHGAIGVLLVTDPLNHIMLTPQGYPWPSLSKLRPQDKLPLDLCINKPSVPFAQVGESVIKFLFGSIDSLKNIQRRIDQNLKPNSFLITNSKCDLATKLIIHETVAKNVVGYIKGRNSKLKSELLVIGGHYDHVGYKEKHKPDEDYIFNGADDNASGTAGVLANAKAFASMKSKPKRSVLFICFAGEELGLYGSDYYCENPLFPLNKTVAMLNLDMIARNGNDTLYIEGFDKNPDLSKIVLEQSKIVGLTYISSKEDMSNRSDLYNFFKNNISAIDIWSGMHKDYHMVSDEPKNINSFKAAQISRLTFRTAWIVANEKRHYAIVKEKSNTETKKSSTSK